MSRRWFALLALVSLLGGWWLLRDRKQAAIVGLWEASAPRTVTDPLQFYYFHESGIGLYRYGQVGYNQTHGFDWSVSGDVLTMRFRKTGDVKKTRFAIERRDGASVLLLSDDPRGNAGTRYRKNPAIDATLEGPLVLTANNDAGSGIERMWMRTRKLTAGGIDFSMYQFSKHDAGAARVGWFHTGDFDEWTTELLSYRQQPGALALRFILRAESATVPATIAGGKERTLTMEKDPRDFGARRAFSDRGPSF